MVSWFARLLSLSQILSKFWRLDVQHHGVDGVSCGRFLLTAMREHVLPASSLAASGLLAIVSTPWLVDSLPDLRLHLHVTFDIFIYVCICVQAPSFL